jgi:hypothetical protein
LIIEFLNDLRLNMIPIVIGRKAMTDPVNASNRTIINYRLTAAATTCSANRAAHSLYVNDDGIEDADE